MYKDFFEKIDFIGHKEKLIDIMEMLICDAKENDEDLYEHIENELYEMAYGKKISEEMGKKWVKNMKPVGCHWSIEDTTNVMNDLGFRFDPVDFYVVANMMYNDYYDLTKNDEELAINLAKMWLDDKDVKDHKLYNYWKYII